MKEKFKIVGIIALAAIFALSFVSCDLDDDPCKDGHTFGNWELVGEGDALAIEKECSECGEVEELTKAGLAGDWKSGDSQTVTISANGDFMITNAAGNANWTLKSATWKVEKTYDTDPQVATKKAEFAFGFGLSSGTVGGTSSNPWAGNTAGTAGVYINKDASKIIVRLTTLYLATNSIAKDFEFQKVE